MLSAFCYSTLLNFKHLYLYCAPAFFIYLLVHYVFNSNKEANSISRLAKVGAITLLPFFISFGPFVVSGGLGYLQQILSRLFPFGRGLVHEYWAPNFWALYFLADKILAAIATKFSAPGLRVSEGNPNTTLKFLP